MIQQGALVTLRSRQLRVFVVACLYCLAGPAIGQTFPTRPITMMVPQNVGGTNDIVGRIVALKLGEVLGGSVVVENRPGAGGNIGTAIPRLTGATASTASRTLRERCSKPSAPAS